jgi:hypothetical protein
LNVACGSGADMNDERRSGERQRVFEEFGSAQ